MNQNFSGEWRRARAMENDIPTEECIEVESGIEERINKRCRLVRTQTLQSRKICPKEERNASIKKVSVILQKSEEDRSSDEIQLLLESSEAVEEVQSRWRKRDQLKSRLKEFEDPADELNRKCEILAQAIAQSQHLVVYTGAGISTAAKIPDYRGPNGIWTRLQQGKDIGNHDLSLAEPTYTHMALAELYRRKILRYVVSQNCDGLHLRSGLPRSALSELHGNMYMEVCTTCKPHKEYWRLFDVTENTARYSHKTMRKCYVCNGALVDTIVHFGERGTLQWPLNWSGACKNAKLATTILCLGSSLKVLKKYPWLWQMDKPAKKRPNLYIVNLQWTPKDDFANVKINGKCDEVMKILMKILDIQVPRYEKTRDPIFVHATKLDDGEVHTTTQPILKFESDFKKEADLKGTDRAEEYFSVSNQVKSEYDVDVKLNLEECSNSQVDLNQSNGHICDISSNKSENIQNNFPGLPKKENTANTSNTIFTIDSILHRSPVVNRQSLPFHYIISPNHPFVGYSFANTLIHNQVFSAYSDYMYYPYQTSLLYSGLHNIINTVSPVKEEYCVEKKSEDQIIKKIKPSCSFCDIHFDSVSCVFYPSIEAKFHNPQYRFSKTEQKDRMNICICCDYTTDEDNTMDVDANRDACSTEQGQQKEVKTKVQAGWFGKGYKKNGRVKKR